eukprot:SRR837773.6710.p1 GENE.SRR837773.6710~~SRR837773.6710.p1  ORF type:complete len:241 (-),score=47.62 SRR837773.6710:38-760(-)
MGGLSPDTVVAVNGDFPMQSEDDDDIVSAAPAAGQSGLSDPKVGSDVDSDIPSMEAQGDVSSQTAMDEDEDDEGESEAAGALHEDSASLEADHKLMEREDKEFAQSSEARLQDVNIGSLIELSLAPADVAGGAVGKAAKTQASRSNSSSAAAAHMKEAEEAAKAKLRAEMTDLESRIASSENKLAATKQELEKQEALLSQKRLIRREGYGSHVGEQVDVEHAQQVTDDRFGSEDEAFQQS